MKVHPMHSRFPTYSRIAGSALLVFVLFLLGNSCAHHGAEEDAVTPTEMATNFATPPDSVKPWVYWYWISDNISREGITRDLEAMARVGIGEAFIGNIGLDDIMSGNIPVLSEEWWQLVEHAIREGKRVGVNIGMFNCPGWSQSGGPWVKPDEAMRYLVFSETRIVGGRRIEQKLACPKDTFQDVRVLAFPVPLADASSVGHLKPRIKVLPPVANPERLIDGNPETACSIKAIDSTRGISIDIESGEPFTARSLSIRQAGKPFAADIDLQIQTNGLLQTVKSFTFDRSNPDVSVGPMPAAPVMIAVPEITSTHFRILIKNTRDRSNTRLSDIDVAEVELSSAPRIERYIEKQLGKMHQDPFPLWKEYQWPPQNETGTKAMTIDPGSVLDISPHLSADGWLTWDAPAGSWIVMRTGTTPTGTKNSPAAPHGKGLEVDKMNREHLRKHFDAFIGELLRRMPPEDRSSLKHVVLDSYEQGSENWTEGFAEDFQNEFGYNPIPWLPTLSGRVVGSVDQSDRFLWDLRRKVADRVAYDYVGGLRDLSQEHGLRVWLENYGHWGFPSEFLMYGGQTHDLGGEFWAEGELGNIECRAASSAAHTYGKRRVSAESYTAAGLPFRRYPAMLKRRGDWSYTEGINHVVLHVYIHQPYEEKSPGINAWFGIEFNRKNTWFEQSKKWINYQRRCMYMLQRGNIVNDICYFIGEDAPKMTGVRNPELPKGYSFDYINAEVILRKMSVDDGQLVLPDGMKYRVMVLPPLKSMRPELLGKIRQLTAEGATILGSPVDRSPSLQNYPAADSTVRTLSRELWGEGEVRADTLRTYKKGRLFSGVRLESALHRIGVLPDVSVPDDIPLLWIHRRTTDSDIYFITNQDTLPLSIEVKFRVRGKQPALWDPVTGTIRNLPAYRQQGEQTMVPLKLVPSGSLFVVFNGDDASHSDRIEDNFPPMETIAVVNSPWEVRFDPLMRGPTNPVRMITLQDWSKSADEAIRYYSGTAIYSNTIVLPVIPEGPNALLDLGRVSAMAEVHINGQSAGGVWTAPWQLDVTKLLRKGENSIQIDVVNTWANRLTGDSRITTADPKTWTAVPASQSAGTLELSGLLGPVSVKLVKYQK
jgi:hypothetical protein